VSVLASCCIVSESGNERSCRKKIHSDHVSFELSLLGSFLISTGSYGQQEKGVRVSEELTQCRKVVTSSPVRSDV
jgi:hypothetical protein